MKMKNGGLHFLSTRGSELRFHQNCAILTNEYSTEENSQQKQRN